MDLRLCCLFTNGRVRPWSSTRSRVFRGTSTCHSAPITSMLCDSCINEYECTTEQLLTGLLHIRDADVSFSLTRWQHYHFAARMDVMDTGRRFEIMTSNQKSDSVSQCLFAWRTFLPISSQSDLKRRSMGLFEEVAPNKKNNNKMNKMSCDMRLGADLKHALAH